MNSAHWRFGSEIPQRTHLRPSVYMWTMCPLVPVRESVPECPPHDLGTFPDPVCPRSIVQQMLSSLVAPLSWNAGAVPVSASARCAQLPIGRVLVGLAVRRWAEGVQRLRKGTRLAEQSTSHQRVARPAGRAEHSTIRAALSDQHYQTSTIRAEHSRYRCWPSNDSTDSTGSRELLDRYRAGPIPSGPPTTVPCAGLAAAPPSTCARCSSLATGR